MSHDTKVAGRIAIITGASSGIGLALVKRLLASGYSVVAGSRTVSTANVLDPSDRLKLVDGDVAEPAMGKSLLEAALGFGKGVDLLVNNAGIFVPSPFEDYTPEQFQRVIGTNTAGFFYTTQPVVRQMKAQGSGHIVTISTALVDQPISGLPCALTSLTKGGLNAVTRNLALELVSHGIRVNAIGTGIIDTPLHSPEIHGYLKGLQPMGRVGTVDEVCDAIEYLERATFVTGEIHNVDGGAHAGRW